MSIPFDSAVTGSVSDQEEKSGPESGIADRKSESGHNENGTPSARFCSEIAPQATRYAMSIMRRWSDAEEVVQEAFCRLIQSGKLNQLQPDCPGKPESGGRAVLFATVRNLSIDRLREQGRRKYESFDASQIASSRFNTNETQLARLETGVQAVLKEMPSEWADALQLKMNGKLSYDEISNVLGATHGQVRTWIFRARKQLAKDLKRQGLLNDGSDHE